MNKYKPLDEVYDIVRNANKLLIQIWSSEILFSWRWWLQIILTILPWVLWIKFRDKKNTVRLLFVGFIVMQTTNILDIIGLSFHLWHYDWKVFPVIPVYIPWDYTLFPTFVMLLLQYKPTVKPLYKATAFSFLSSFIFEPFFYWLGLYHTVAWKYWYSYIIYIPLYLLYSYIYNSKLFSNNST